MTLEDESLLTAYLDGELDPDQRSSIESALLADTELAEQLRRLAAVRDLVAGLPRPVLTRDLVEAIGARTGRRPALEALASRSLPRLRGFAMLGGLGLAATVLVALSIALHAKRPVREPALPGVLSEPEDRSAGSPTSTVASAPPTRPVASTVVASVAAPAPIPVPASGEATRKSEEAAAAQRAREAETIRAMLDSPELRRTFIVLDVQGGTARDRVEELVQKTPRTEAAYGRITVTQGIVIDPRHPNEATVFALVMNERELGHFQKKLKQSFPDRVEDADADPAVVTQLADIGQVAVLPGSSAAQVVIPTEVSPRIAALRTDEALRGRHMTNDVIPRDFDVSEPVGNRNLAEPLEREALEKEGNPEDATHRRASGELQPSLLARKEDRTPASGPEEGAGKPPFPALPAGPLAEALFRAPDLHERPAIVLVWVTTQ